jgi:hypothetical protein
MAADREPMRRGRNTDRESKEMELPEGKTCADCVHCRRCCAIFGHIPADEVCDFHPSRFQAEIDHADACPTTSTL